MKSDIRRLSSDAPDFDAQIAALQAPMEVIDPGLVTTVSEIIGRIRERGDAAILELTQSLDDHAVTDMSDLIFDRQRLSEFEQRISDAERSALKTAAARIERYHQQQLIQDWSIEDEYGSRLGQRILAMSSAGLYVPGGKASYPSSVLMNAIPAKVAGVPDVTMVAPTPGGKLNPLVMAAASMAGVDRVVTIGGAQAVAALAYGTESIKAVDKIVGPGNRFVAEAKRQVFGKVGIDMIAGPSEIFVIADGSVDPKWIALDLMSQAEHDEVAQAVCISPNDAYLDAVAEAIDALLPTMPRRSVIEASLKNRGALIVVEDLERAARLSNLFAPEHLELAVRDADQLLPHITHAGAIFLGAYSSESLGDYCVGTNHVLPTSGAARFSSPLSVYDFQTRTSIIDVNSHGAKALAEVAGTIADGESLAAHAMAARIRVEDPS
ncbi:MAG: histidinol dehydrogenase [Cellvibrionales bacterium TMED79]|nr:histidinol dehydrogenase [Halieaceae bacterium]OUV03859.1 MAG: histidinol dehydrogenase [Cellvibrionales bacterium TMED79]